MTDFNDLQRDSGRLRQRVDAGDRAARRAAQEDVIVEYPRRLLLRSPDGTFFAIGVADNGTLTATNMGQTL
jgi:hypothetical protein